MGENGHYFTKALAWATLPSSFLTHPPTLFTSPRQWIFAVEIPRRNLSLLNCSHTKVNHNNNNHGNRPASMSATGKCLPSFWWKACGFLSRRLMFQDALQVQPGETTLKSKVIKWLLLQNTQTRAAHGGRCSCTSAALSWSIQYQRLW